MAGPCWSTPLPRIRLAPEAVKSGAQLDLFQGLRPVELAASPAGSLAPAMVPGLGVEVPSWQAPAGVVAADDAILEGGWVRIWYLPHDRARRYRLMLRPDGSARCTIPRRGTLKEARRFVDGARAWLSRELQRRAARRPVDRTWRMGTPVWFRGEPVPLEAGAAVASVGSNLELKLGAWTFRAQWPKSSLGGAVPGIAGADPTADLRSMVEKALRRLAADELPRRVAELAAAAGVTLARVSVRNQRTRWGSCSRHGVISLNWRLVQVPEFVRDYIILHELAHRRQLNHSARFWDEVARMCPGWEAAEAWIKRHGRELL